MKFGSVASILAATFSAGGAIVGYWIFKPSTLENYLKWKGHKLAEAKDQNLWKSIYEENKDSFERDFSSQIKTDHWKAVKEYCIKAFKKNDYSSDIEKATKWCVDDVQTVKGQMVRDGIEIKNLMTDLKQYKVAATFEASKPFWALANPSGNNLSSKAQAYKEWCDNSLKSKPTKNSVQNVKNFCNDKGYSNFKQKLEQDKEYTPLSKRDIDGKYAELKLDTFKPTTHSNILVIIGGGEDKWKEALLIQENKKVDQDQFKSKYQAYCKDQANLDFSEDDKDYVTLYSEYRGLCGKENKKVN